MSRLLRRAARRHLLRHRWQSLLAVLGIALGVAVVVAVDLANSSARRALELSVTAFAGPATHRITAVNEGPFSHDWYLRLRNELGLRSSAPVVSGELLIDEQRFTLLGTDVIGAQLGVGRQWGVASGDWRTLLLTPEAVAATSRVARQLDTVQGETLQARRKDQTLSLQLALVVDSDDPSFDRLLLADIATAQHLLGRHRLDRIELRLDAAQTARLREWLPPSLRLNDLSQEQSGLTELTDAFHINLTAMSLLALMVGALLIYNTVSFSVLQRRREFGIQRGLGVTPGAVQAAILRDTALLAGTGTLAGLALGTVLAQSLLELVTRTIDDLYFNLQVRRFFLDWGSLAKSTALGLGASLLAALPPAREARRAQPISLQQSSGAEQRSRQRLPLLLYFSLPVLLLGWLLAQRSGGGLIEGFVALALLLAGFCLAVPALLQGGIVLCLRGAGPRLALSNRLALRGIAANTRRTAPACAALTLAVATTAGVGIMIASFRDSVDRWLDQTLAGDIYIGIQTEDFDIAPPLTEQLAAVPGVAALDRRYFFDVQTQFGELSLLAVARDADSRFRFNLLSSATNALQRFASGEGVFISEPLAFHRGLSPGDTISVRTPRGERQWPVLGVFIDYSSSRGRLLASGKLLQRYWNTGPTSLALYVAADASPQTVLQRVRDVIAATGAPLSALSNRDIKQRSLAIFDRTFAITQVLRLLTVLVAFVGVLSALLALQLERLRDLALLRALGTVPAQVAGLVFKQALLLGLAAGALAIPLGLLMADVLIDVINRRAFGWTIQTTVPPAVLIEALALALAAAALAGLHPALRASRGPVMEPLREE